MQSVNRIYRLSAAILLLTAGIFILPAIGQEATAKKDNTVGPFEGTVVDAAGKPVAGAEVWLIGGEQDDPQIVAKTTSNDKGRFQIAKQTWDMSAAKNQPIPTMLASRDSAGRIGGSMYFGNSRLPNDVSPKEFSIKLQDVKDCQGRLVDEAGQPVAKATIQPTSWATYPTREERVQQLIFFPTSMMKEMTVESQADGRFTIRGLPTIGHVSVKIRAEGFGEPQAFWKLDKIPTLQLGRVGHIEGTVACEKDPKAAAAIKLILEPDMPRGYGHEPDWSVFYHSRCTTKENGDFQFQNVPPGKYRVGPNLPSTSHFYSKDAGNVEVKPKESARVSLALLPAVKVQGKVVDKESGEGVAGVRIALFDNQPFETGQNTATSDAKGEFTLYTRPGKATLQIWQIPDSHIISSSRQPDAVEIKGDMTLDPIRLDQAKAFEGFVVDKSGKPAADAEIRYTDADFSGSLQENVHTDAAGKFTLNNVSLQKTLILRARSKTACADPVNVVPEKLKEPLRIVIDEKTAFTLRGTAVDDAGKPIPQADVGLTSHWSHGSGGISFQSHTCKTDDAGLFEFGGLWPGDQYQVTLSAKNSERFGSTTISAKPGGLHDLGKITLFAVNGAVEGMVVDSSGKPLANVRVFNSGDGLKRIDASTDEAGIFKLQGLRNGPVFVFAEKTGFRFTGIRTASGVKDAVLKMLRADEPAPKRPMPSSASRIEEERKFARMVLEKYLTSSDNGLKQWARRTIDRMDAQDKQGKEARDASNPSNEKPIHKIAEEDLDEALGMIPKPDDQAYHALVDLAKHLAAKNPEKALRCAEEAIVRVRNMDQPRRTVLLAIMGALVTQLGNKEAGRKLALEAAETAAKWELTDRNRWDLSAIANAVAACDVDRGVALLEKFPKSGDRDRFLADLAATLDDVEKAESLLKGIESWAARDARIHLAYRIAAKRPAEAVRILESSASRSGGYEEEEKATAFGWIAVAIAPKDKAMAYSLIDRGFQIILTSTDREMYSYGGRPTRAAVLALEADQIGYPDMESVIFRALATRATADANDFTSPVVVQECNMMLALYLALLDPESAKQVLQAIEPHSDCIGSGYRGIMRMEWFKAWALVDPQHAADLIERELASPKEPRAKQDAESGLQEMVELWIAAPENRLKRISERYRQMFPPVEEN